jgi:hypothetical protein
MKQIIAFYNYEKTGAKIATFDEFTAFVSVLKELVWPAADYLPGADRFTAKDADGNIIDIMYR